MTFSFSAAGRREDVIRQVRSHHQSGVEGLASAVRDLIADALEGAAEIRTTEYEYAYLVEASGHDGSGGTSLNVVIRPIWVPAADMPKPDDLDERAKNAYRAYFDHTGWKTFDGRDMPLWMDLGEKIQGAWKAAAGA